jgi:hypothetical protein
MLQYGDMELKELRDDDLRTREVSGVLMQVQGLATCKFVAMHVLSVAAENGSVTPRTLKG